MGMVIKKLIVENFKKIKDVSFDFDSIGNKIYGENGTGKTTIADAWFWLISGKSYSLTDNPDIRPNDAEDGDITRVTAELEIDDRPLTISKYQKFKRSKPDANGVVKISTTNGYEVNSVEYSERDFKKKLSEDYGVDFEKILQLSHPDMFISGLGSKATREEMRKTLFEMTSDFTDLDIANLSTNTKDVAELLNNYSFDEIESMQKATIRKIRETYGKEGEIIDARISEASRSKVEINLPELEKTKTDLEKQIADYDRQIAESVVDTSDLQDELSRTRIEISTIENNAKMKLNGEKQKIREALLERQNKVGQLKGNVSFIEMAMKQNTATMDSLKSEIDDLRGKVAEIKTKEFDADAWKFDETTTICSLCGQRLPDDRISELKESFEQKKAEAEQDFNVKKNAEIKRLVDRGRDATEEYHKAKDNEENKAAELEKLSNELCQADKEAEDLQRQLEAMPGDVDLSDNAEYTALIDKANDLEKQITDARFSTKDTTEIQEKKDCAKNQLELTLAEIGKAQMNNDFDERISDLNAQKKQLEQEKADCEKILYQLSIVSQKKNTMLEESVNKHFKIVKWKLFDTQKNGTVIDSCIPLIDGYQFGTSTNTGREILAKLDIIEGMQNYFNQHYPVFLDGAEALSKVTADRIGIAGQIVMMIVSEDKKLKFNERN